MRGERVTTGDKLRDIFAQQRELNPTEAYRELKESPGFRGGYNHVLRLFYVLRELGLIEFSYEAEGLAPISKRYHRVVSGCQSDSRWHLPMTELYPSASIGGLFYVKGSGQGRRREYA